jgi:type VI secretion system protein ImpA
MNHILHQRAADSCALLLGVALSTLIAPIDQAAPAGASLRANGVYRTIAQARLADDSTLPRGAWERELKRADWDRVSKVAVSALSGQGKDLQVAAWLLEAQINKNGFASLATSLHLIQQLCHNYWDELYPVAEGAGLEHRANIFRWMNEKLLPALRQTPLAGLAPGPRYGYADWERARRHDELRLDADNKEGASSAELAAAISATPTAFYVAMDGDLEAALAALDELTATIAPHFGGQAPSLAGFENALRQIRTLVASELHQRGVRAPSLVAAAPAADAPAAGAAETPPPASAPAPGGPLPAAPESIRDREHAYATLALAADFLLRTEPHSPVPYLLRRAASWGQMNAGQLYQELFLRLGGQLNIFSDVMGLDVEPRSTEQA